MWNCVNLNAGCFQGIEFQEQEQMLPAHLAPTGFLFFICQRFSFFFKLPLQGILEQIKLPSQSRTQKNNLSEHICRGAGRWVLSDRGEVGGL